MGEPRGGEMEIQLGEGWDEEETKKVAPILVWDTALDPLNVSSLWLDN